MNRGRGDLAWATRRQAAVLICRGATFDPAARIALVVGTLLTLVNQAGVLLDEGLQPVTAARIAANYAIPYVVSSLGYLASYRDPASTSPEQSDRRRRGRSA